jgi:EmrB/QacA subfamily drug resistance transporter
MKSRGFDSSVWLILIAMACVGGLIVLDETVVSVALPSIRHDLGMTAVGTHWIVSIYVLVFSGFSAAGGKLGDLYGLRRVFLVSLWIFGLASLAAGFAWNGNVLIAARAVQGLGAAVMFPASIAVAARSVDEARRGQALGIVIAIATSFLTAGPLVGGLFTELVSWRWIFWINVPIALAAILLAMARLPAFAPKRSGMRLDAGGLLSLVAGLSLIVFAIMQGGDWGVTNPLVAGAFVLGIVAMAAWIRIEKRGTDPLIEVDLFSDPGFSAALCVIGVAQFSKIVVLVVGALYLQDVLMMSPIEAGWVLLASVLATPFTAAPAGRVADACGERLPVLAGLAIASLMVLAIALLVPFDRYWLLLPPLLIWGATLPICFQPALRIVMNAVPPEAQGQSSGISTTVRMLGATLGMAFGSLVLSLTSSYASVFLLTAILMLLVLAVAYLAIRQAPAGADAPHALKPH